MSIQNTSEDRKQFELKPWQQVVVKAVESHEELISGQEWQSLSQFDINRMSSVSIAMPRGEGHTTLTAYLHCFYDAVVVYFDMTHWKEIQRAAGKFGFVDNPKTTAISVYELHYAMANSHDLTTMGVWKGIKERVEGKQILVVDRASEMISGMKDNLLNLTSGMAVFLG
jgi:hypothetical protein